MVSLSDLNAKFIQSFIHIRLIQEIHSVELGICHIAGFAALYSRWSRNSNRPLVDERRLRT